MPSSIADISQVTAQIQGMYIGLLGRAADPLGLAYWVDQIESGKRSLENVLYETVLSPEYADGLGAMSREDALVVLYNNMFNRDPDPGGFDYWTNGDGAAVPFDELVLALMRGAGPGDRGRLNDKIVSVQTYTEEALKIGFDVSAAELAAGVPYDPVFPFPNYPDGVTDSSLLNDFGGTNGFGTDVGNVADVIDISSIIDEDLEIFGEAETAFAIDPDGQVFGVAGLGTIFAPYFDSDFNVTSGSNTESVIGNSTGANRAYYALDPENNRFVVTWDDLRADGDPAANLNAFQFILTDTGSEVGDGTFTVEYRYEVTSANISDALEPGIAPLTAAGSVPTPFVLPEPFPNLDEIFGNTGDIGRWMFYFGSGEFKGTSGDDVLAGTIGYDTITGGSGNDRISAIYGDGINPNSGNFNGVTINAGGGRDTISGTDDDDIISGGSGNDFIEGNGGSDRILGGSGADAIGGGAGSDLIEGGGNNDRISGNAGDDTILGGGGDDELFGGGGTNVLVGGAGDDLLISGLSGKNRFVFMDDDSVDTVNDFSDGNDLIELIGFGLTDFNDLVNEANIRHTDSSTIISLDDTSVVINGLTEALFDATDFVIAPFSIGFRSETFPIGIDGATIGHAELIGVDENDPIIITIDDNRFELGGDGTEIKLKAGQTLAAGQFDFTLTATNLFTGESVDQLITYGDPASEADDPLDFYVGELELGGMGSGAVNPENNGSRDPDPANSDYWYFFGEAGDTITIDVDRAVAELDPRMWLFEGLITDPFLHFGAQIDNGDPGHLADADDNDPEPPGLEGPFADPIITITLPSTGYYTIIVTNYISDDDDGDGQLEYDISMY